MSQERLALIAYIIDRLTDLINSDSHACPCESKVDPESEVDAVEIKPDEPAHPPTPVDV